MNKFEGSHGNKDGKVTLDEFIEYYTELSMSIVSDDQFVSMMESAW